MMRMCLPSRRVLLFSTIIVVLLCSISSFRAAPQNNNNNDRSTLLASLSRGTSSYSSISSSSMESSSSSACNPSDSKNQNLLILDPLVVCGPSGVGKGTLIARFLQRQQQQQQNSKQNNHPMNNGKDQSRVRLRDDQRRIIQFQFSVSHTTRAKRPGEVDGVHYHFVSEAQMQQLLLDDGALLEHAHVHGHTYGTSWRSVVDVHLNTSSIDIAEEEEEEDEAAVAARIERKCVLDIDVQGVQSLKAMESMRMSIIIASLENDGVHDDDDDSCRRCVQLRPKFVFIAPPSLQSLTDRLVMRGSESAESIQIRTAQAAAELDFGMRHLKKPKKQKSSSSNSSVHHVNGNYGPDHDGNIFDAMIVNDDLEQAVLEFENVVAQLYS